jgi:hypothetical protein
LLGIRSLAFAVGSYLSIGTTLAIFAGGVVRWLAERGTATKEHAESEVSPGSLFASGLIAAGGVIGLLAIVKKVLEDVGTLPKDWLRILTGDEVKALAEAGATHWTLYPWLAVLMFALLAFSLFHFARKKMS